jgi:uncharacterized membrane protein
MTSTPRPRHRRRWALSPHHAVGRLTISLVVGLATYAIVAPLDVAWWVRSVAAWDAGALTLVALAWSVILRADSKETARRAGSDDPGRHVVFLIAVLASVFSFFAAAFVLRHVRTFEPNARTTWTLLTLTAIVLAWAVAHTAYALRYAHLFYGQGGHKGLQFPGDEPPADVDFAYFAFTIGMCFQVSDVVVASTQCRRAVLLHSVLSFFFNTGILALALNIVLASMT